MKDMKYIIILDYMTVYTHLLRNLRTLPDFLLWKLVEKATCVCNSPLNSRIKCMCGLYCSSSKNNVQDLKRFISQIIYQLNKEYSYFKVRILGDFNVHTEVY